MAYTLPRLIVLKPADYPQQCIYYSTDDSEHERGTVLCREKSVFDPFVKIEVETSKTSSNLIHLRFSQTNKYLTRDDANNFVAATSGQPEEDVSKASCTLFEPMFLDEKLLYFKHVQSDQGVRINDTRVSVGDNYDKSLLRFVNWSALVKFPEHVAFKGDNGKYLKGEWIEGYQYLHYSSGDGNEEGAAYDVHLMPDGFVRIKSIYFGKFWRRSPNWIWADSSDESNYDEDTLFWPVKIDDKTVALQNAGNGYFCKRLTTEGKTDCLNAAVANINTETRMEVEELVRYRKIYNVKYQWDDALIYNEVPFVAGTTTAINRSDMADSMAVKVSRADSRSHTFTSSVSITVGVKTTIEADLLVFTSAKIEVSGQISGSFTWGDTETETTTVESTGTVQVPARSKAIVRYVGTQGTLSIPFSYTREDQRSSDGHFVYGEHVDGIYTGINCYNFQFEILEIVPL